MGPSRPAARAPAAEFHTTYSLSPFAERVHEVLTALDVAGGQRALVGEGATGPACLLAGALSKRVKALDVDMCGVDPGREEAWRRHLDTPCIRQVGGLATAFALVGGRPLRLRSATPAVAALAHRYAR